MNEITNGVPRQFLNKNGIIGVQDQAELDGLAERLSNRPRAVLEWRPPGEVYRRSLIG